MPKLPAALGPRHLTLFRAALGQGQTAIDAYQAWRASEPLDAADEVVYRTMPLLVATADMAGIVDADTKKMRGVVKHVWLSNTTRVRDVVAASAALKAAGIAALLIKGGALFARDESYMAKRMTGDYDLLVRRTDAPRAIEVLRQADFRSHGMRVELFSESDFDRDIHAVAMSRAGLSRAIDLHWRALFWLDDEGFTEALFATAETGTLLTHEVLIPGLAEHLAIAAMRPEPADQNEMVSRALEVVHVLESKRRRDGRLGALPCDRDALQWQPVCGAIARRRRARDAGPHSRMVSWSSCGITARRGSRSRSRSAPCRARGARHGSSSGVAFFAALRARFKAPFRGRDWLKLPGAAIAAFDAGIVQFPLLRDAILKRIWQQVACVAYPSRGSGVWFGQGFSIPEDEGRWTDRQFAVLEVPVDDRTRDPVAVELAVVPFLPPGTDNFRFVAYAGVGSVQQMAAGRTDPMPHKITLKARVVGRGQRKIVVALRMLDCQRPTDIGHSIDPRLLGLFVKQVVINGVTVFTPAGAGP